NVDVYSDILSASLSRFQHISETYYIIENIDDIKTAHQEKKFTPLLFDNIFRRPLSQEYNYNYQTMGEYIASHYLDKRPGSNIHVGILPWIQIDIFNLLSYISLFFIYLLAFYYLLRNILVKDSILAIASWFWILYFMHGWFSSVFYVLVSLAEISFLYFIIGNKNEK
ncbi:TPA: oligosaccharide repeat unit polymerase, partial [Morganella morganii]|nr:oligosaccharide repeat unit polymerase [Morganella morganii]